LQSKEQMGPAERLEILYSDKGINAVRKEVQKLRDSGVI